jgi:hypothetical protein
MTLAEIREQADTVLADIWTNRLVPRQQEFFAKHGRYAQCLISPASFLDDGATGDFTYRPPHDETWSPDFTFSTPTKIPFQLEVHTHGNDTDHGFTAHLWVRVGGKTYHRQKNYNFGDVDIYWHEFLAV